MMPFDVLQDHDGVVDQDPDHERHAEQRDRVDGEAGELHHDHGDEQGERDSDEDDE